MRSSILALLLAVLAPWGFAVDSIAVTNGSTTFQEQSSGTYVWPGQVSITTSGTIDNYQIGAQFSSGQQTDDTLFVQQTTTDSSGLVDSILVSNNAIYVVINIGTVPAPVLVSIVIGEQTLGTATTPLAIRFNRNANSTMVTAVANRIAFSTPSKNPTSAVRVVTPWFQPPSAGSATTGTGQVSIHCSLINDPPISSAQSFPTVGLTSTYVYRDSTFTNTLAVTDVDNSQVTITLIKGPSNGTVTFGTTLPVTFRYQPTSGYVGSDTFSYTASDGQYSTTEVTVALTVSEPPVGTYTFGTVLGVTLVTTIPAPPLGTAWTVSTGAALGNLNLTGTLLTYQPKAAGQDHMVLSCTDGVTTKTQPLTVITSPAEDEAGKQRPQFTSTPQIEDINVGNLWTYDAAAGNAAAISFQITLVDPSGTAVSPTLTALSSTAKRIAFTPTTAGCYTLTIIALSTNTLASDAQVIKIIARSSGALRPGGNG